MSKFKENVPLIITFAISMVAFTILSIYFKHWWISLFTLVVLPSVNYYLRGDDQ